MHLYEFFTESPSVLHGKRSFFQDETVDVKSETHCPIPERERTGIFRILMIAHNVPDSADEGYASVPGGDQRIQRVQNGLFQIRLHRIKQVRCRINIDEYSMLKSLMQS